MSQNTEIIKITEEEIQRDINLINDDLKNLNFSLQQRYANKDSLVNSQAKENYTKYLNDIFGPVEAAEGREDNDVINSLDQKIKNINEKFARLKKNNESNKSCHIYNLLEFDLKTNYENSKGERKECKEFILYIKIRLKFNKIFNNTENEKIIFSKKEEIVKKIEDAIQEIRGEKFKQGAKRFRDVAGRYSPWAEKKTVELQQSGGGITTASQVKMTEKDIENFFKYLKSILFLINNQLKQVEARAAAAEGAVVAEVQGRVAPAVVPMVEEEGEGNWGDMSIKIEEINNKFKFNDPKFLKKYLNKLLPKITREFLRTFTDSSDKFNKKLEIILQELNKYDTQNYQEITKNISLQKNSFIPFFVNQFTKVDDLTDISSFIRNVEDKIHEILTGKTHVERISQNIEINNELNAIFGFTANNMKTFRQLLKTIDEKIETGQPFSSIKAAFEKDNGKYNLNLDPNKTTITLEKIQPPSSDSAPASANTIYQEDGDMNKKHLSNIEKQLIKLQSELGDHKKDEFNALLKDFKKK